MFSAFLSNRLEFADRECPLFNKARDDLDEAIAGGDPSQKLMNDMKETGLAMTRSAINTLEQMAVPMQVFIFTRPTFVFRGNFPHASILVQELQKKPAADEDEEMAFIKTLSTKDKKKLLKYHNMSFNLCKMQFDLTQFFNRFLIGN